MTPSFVSRFSTLFRGRENAYGQYLVIPDGDNDIKTVREATPTEAWERHLKGKGHGLGVVPIMLSNACYFGAIDLDDDETDHISLAELVREKKLPLVVCKSKSGGAHLYLFLTDPAPAKVVAEKLRLWANLLGVANVDGRSIEIFPKQGKLREEQVGNWINLPYYGGSKHHRVAVGPEGSFLTMPEFLALAESAKITSDELRVWNVKSTDDRFQHAPPCLAALDTVGYGAGGRNSGLYNVCVFFKMSAPESWQEDATAYNREKMDPPLPDQEVATIIDSVTDRDYGYKGNEPPLYQYCCMGGEGHLKAVCGQKKFGCAASKRASAIGALPSLTNLRKLESRPPVYFLSVGDKDLQLSLEDLATFRKFRLAIMAECDTLLPNMKEETWVQIVDPLLAECEKIEAPPEASQAGVLAVHLEEFLDQRHQTNDREDLLRELPVEEEGVCLFRAHDFAAFLDRRRFNISHHELWAILRTMGASNTSVAVKGKGTHRVWKLNTPDSQTEEFSTRVDDGPTF